MFMDNTEVAEDLFGNFRVQHYLEFSKNDLERALQLYEWNINLAAAYLPALETVETIVSNRISRSLFPSGYVSKLAVGQYTTGKYTQGDDLVHVSDMSFGFWVYMLAGENNNQAWTPKLHREFRPKTRRAVLHEDLAGIKKFRNSVAHHEPIWQTNFEALDGRIDRVLWAVSQDAVLWGNRIHQHKAAVASKPSWL